MDRLDKMWQKNLQDIHEKAISILNDKRKQPAVFSVGDQVFYRRPEGSGTKLDSRWLGPAIILAREGEQSYLFRLREGVDIKAHQTFLKPSYNKEYLGRTVPLFYLCWTIFDPEAMVDEWVVGKIIGHRYDQGLLKFRTLRQGYDIKSAPW
jgi:hypothetical protein